MVFENTPYVSYPTLILILPILILITVLLYLYLPPTYTSPSVASVCVSSSHNFTKTTTSTINLIQGLGVEGDAHLGATVQHLSRIHIRPPPTNLRQVHLIGIETLKAQNLQPGDIGENIATSNLSLLTLPRGARLRFIPESSTKDDLSLDEWKTSVSSQTAETQSCPSIIIQGLRNPCPQIEKFRPGLQEHFIERDSERRIINRTAGVMGTVEVGGVIKPGMTIVVELPDEPRMALECV